MQTIPARTCACDAEGCCALLLESEAIVSRRALGGLALCWRCRRDRVVVVTDALPAGCNAVALPVGYGRWTAHLGTPAGPFTGSGWSPTQATMRATAKARAAGVVA